MNRLLQLAVVASLALVVAAPAATPNGTGLEGTPSTAGKKRCKYVVKKVKGKKKRVRVCRNVPAPKPPLPKPPPPAPSLLKVAATIPVGFSPAGIAVADGAVWAASWFTEPAGKVVRIDPTRNVVTATIALPATGFTWVAAGSGSVWVAIAEGGPEPGASHRLTVVRIDPQTNSIVATLRPGVAPARPAPIAIGEGAVWATNFEESTVARIDPATNALVTKIATTAEPGRQDRGHPSGIAVTAGAVWVMNHREGKLLRIDPATNAIVATVDTQDGRVGAGEGSVWVAAAGGDRVDRIDPATNRVTATIFGCRETHDVAVGGGFVWVTQANALCLIDSRTSKVVENFPVTRGSSQTFSVAYGDGAAWVTDVAAKTVVRVERAG